MCSICSGDYENPDVTAPGPDICEHVVEVRWDPNRGTFECLNCGTFLDIPELTESVFDPDVAVKL